MDLRYVQQRQQSPALQFRYRTRALAAVQAFHEFARVGGPPRVLELGAAEGLALLEVRRRLGGVGTYVGLEASPALVAAARNLPENVRLRVGDACAPPDDLSPGSFNLVVALAVLEHVREPAACIAKAFELLQPGGVFVATCPDPVWDRVAGLLGLVPTEHHEHEIGAAFLEREASAAGFEAVACLPFMWAPVAATTYLRLPVDPAVSLEIDRVVRRNLPKAMHRAFVNQLLVARRPLNGSR